MSAFSFSQSYITHAEGKRSPLLRQLQHIKMSAGVKARTRRSDYNKRAINYNPTYINAVQQLLHGRPITCTFSRSVFQRFRSVVGILTKVSSNGSDKDVVLFFCLLSGNLLAAQSVCFVPTKEMERIFSEICAHPPEVGPAPLHQKLFFPFLSGVGFACRHILPSIQMTHYVAYWLTSYMLTRWNSDWIFSVHVYCSAKWRLAHLNRR